MDSQAPCAPCNVCGGVDFSRGPGERLSITQRLPHCTRCHALERHRVAYRVFQRLAPKYTRGKRLLQFSADPGVDGSWFAEHSLSIWQGPNSLDLQAIDLPDGCYDWIYSSHVLNHVPDDAAALREMARVVGAHGVVALNVGGTVFNYQTRASNSSLGRDYQYRLYGTQFADHVQDVLPEIAVLELIAADPVTASIDSLYLCSRAEALLREMAVAAVSGNIHVRVFPARAAVMEAALPFREAQPASTPVSGCCSICQGTELTFGPGQRRSAPHGRLPGCKACGSLERHRIMNRVLKPLAPRFTASKKLLLLDKNPGVRSEWFAEALVSLRGTDDAVDLNDTGLPDGSYDWACVTHLIAEREEDRGALRELLRVVGPAGIVALSLRGSATKYESVLNLQTAEDVRGIREDYGVDFIDEVQAAFPGLAALELVTSDPTTGSVDAVHLLSFDAGGLQQIAAVCGQHDILTRLFAPGRTKTPTKVAGRSDWDKLRREIEAWRTSGRRARFWLRDDDAGSYSTELAALVDFCTEQKLPLALAVIPARATPPLIQAVANCEHLTVLQHGFDHRNRSSTKQRSEFPDERPLKEALEAIRNGWSKLSSQFGGQALPVFVPPWGDCSAGVRERLAQVGLVGFSGSQVGPFRPIEQCRRGAPHSRNGLRLATTHIAVNRARANDTSAIPKVRHLSFLTRLVNTIRTSSDGDEPVGVMTHAWGVDPSVRDFLRELVLVTRSAGADWVSARDLFLKD